MLSAILGCHLRYDRHDQKRPDDPDGEEQAAEHWLVLRHGRAEIPWNASFLGM